MALSSSDHRDIAEYQKVAIDIKKEKHFLFEDGNDIPETILRMMHAFRNMSFMFVATSFVLLTDADGQIKYPDKFFAKSHLENALYFFIVIRCNSVVQSLEDMGHVVDKNTFTRFSTEAKRLYKFYSKKCRKSRQLIIARDDYTAFLENGARSF